MKPKIENRKSKIHELDHLWQYLVKVAADWRCEICGSSRKGLHAAHIIGRRALWTCWRLRNGLGLCPDCHDDAKIKAWLIANRPKQWAWIVAQKRNIHYSRRPDLRNELRRLKRNENKSA